MDQVIRKAIQYEGIDQGDMKKYVSNDMDCFKEICLQFERQLTDGQKEIKEIFKVKAAAKEADETLIMSPIGISLEGQKLTGCQAIVNTELCIDVHYVGNDQGLYKYRFLVPVCEIIAVDKKQARRKKQNISVYIEDIHVEHYSACQLTGNITLMIVLENYEKQIRSCNKTEEEPMEPKYFKEKLIQEEIAVPCDMPCVKKVIQTITDASIKKYEVLETEKGTSYEGQHLSGIKLLTEIAVSQKISYTDCSCQEKMFVLSHQFNQTMFVILPETIDDISVYVLLKEKKLKISCQVEYTHSKKLNDYLITNHTLLFLQVDKK